MSRYQNMHIFNVHIADGFYEDCEDLIQHCLQLETLNFITFSGLWKDMNFRCIYRGRSSGEEVAELSEEVILIAKRFMLKDTGNFKEALAGLFIVYALLTQQPYANFAWLRVTPEDLPAIKRLKTAARNHRQCDALYILGTILVKHTHYHATERERGFDTSLKKYMDGFLNLNKNGMRPSGIFHEQNDVPDMIKELGTIARRYTQCRDRVTDKSKEIPCKKYVNENLPSQLADSLKKIMNGYDVDDIVEGEKRHTSVQSIKHRAMATAVDSVPHLRTAQEKKEKHSPQKKSEVQSTSNKVKAYSSKCTKTESSKLQTKPLRPAAFFAQLHADHDEDFNASNEAKIRNKKKTAKKYSETDTDESENSETEKHSLKPIGAYTNTSKTKISDKEDVTDESNNDDKHRPAKKPTPENTKKTKSRKGNNEDIKGKGPKKPDKVHKKTKRNQKIELISETDDSDMEMSPPIKRKKHSKDLIGIVHSQSGETECEIEIIDYASNEKVPVYTVLKDILQQNETKFIQEKPTDENT